jgi:hypothetical protein
VETVGASSEGAVVVGGRPCGGAVVSEGESHPLSPPVATRGTVA